MPNMSDLYEATGSDCRAGNKWKQIAQHIVADRFLRSHVADIATGSCSNQDMRQGSLQNERRAK